MSELSTVGQAWRATQYVEAFVWVIGGDPRVQAAYLHWRAAHGLVKGRPLTATEKASINREARRDMARLEQVRDQLGVPYTWLPFALLVDFVATLQGELTGDPTLRFSLAVPEDLNLPLGRKRGGPYILRDVEWYYRAEIKQPPDTIYQLAKEHAKQEGLAGPWHGSITIAIKRTKAHLNSFTVSDGPPLFSRIDSLI